MAEEEKLLMRLKNRKRNAIDEAIEVYTPYLSTVLYNMLGNRLPKEDIEEILSDVFVTLWKNADTIDLEGYAACLPRRGCPKLRIKEIK
mgnify:CR=1 FL=1